MKYIRGVSRNQLVLFPQSLDFLISEENEVRLIDLFAKNHIIKLQIINSKLFAFYHNFLIILCADSENRLKKAYI